MSPSLGRSAYAAARFAFLQYQYLRFVVRSHAAFRRLGLDESISVRPHAVSGYRRLVARLTDAGLRFVTATQYLQSPCDLQRGTVFLRHDVDYCPERLPLLVDVERARGVTSTVYVLVDGVHYELERHADYLRRLAAEGFEVGLHSVCYASPDSPAAALRGEYDRFHACLGFYPRTFTFHGLLSRSVADLQVRSRLVRSPARLTEQLPEPLDVMPGPFDFRLSDASPAVLDSLLPKGFRTVTPRANQNCMVLTHPVHWVAAKR